MANHRRRRLRHDRGRTVVNLPAEMVGGGSPDPLAFEKALRGEDLRGQKQGFPRSGRGLSLPGGSSLKIRTWLTNPVFSAFRLRVQSNTVTPPGKRIHLPGRENGNLVAVTMEADPGNVN